MATVAISLSWSATQFIPSIMPGDTGSPNISAWSAHSRSSAVRQNRMSSAMLIDADAVMIVAASSLYKNGIMLAGSSICKTCSLMHVTVSSDISVPMLEK